MGCSSRRHRLERPPDFNRQTTQMNMRHPAAAVITLLTLLVGGCASNKYAEVYDPFESANRKVYNFNNAIDRNALKPAAKAYVRATPQWLRTGVDNFFTNLFYPTTIAHQLLQGKVVQAGQDTLRLLINSTLGWGGVLDVASGARLPLHDEDSGQTLGRWGVPPGPFLTVPFLGPTTLRDLPARYADTFSQPFHWYNGDQDRWISLGVSLVSKRSQLLPLDDTLAKTYDPYAFTRNAYWQRRQYEVYDGNPPQQAIEEFEDSPPADPKPAK
jgi:phospholipid-binding lipoprotein MlaA